MQQKPVLVRKYGGSSLADDQRLKAVAADIAAKSDEGYSLVVVVSAMGQTTNELSELAYRISTKPARRELDMLLSVGERITMSLMSMALSDLNHTAISFTGSQCGIITTDSHTDAEILEVRCDRVREALDDGHIVVVAGFQGVSRKKEITTLGRGGSDATAVALAAALGAQRCEILKDVDGVFTADPHRIREAIRHDALSYEQMKEIASAGCGVIHPRAVSYAAEQGVPLFVGSSFKQSPGTLIDGDAARPLDKSGPSPRPLSFIVDETASLSDHGASRPYSCITIPFSADEDLETAADMITTVLDGLNTDAGPLLTVCSTIRVLVPPADLSGALSGLHKAFLE
jgi:aspartate kinase